MKTVSRNQCISLLVAILLFGVGLNSGIHAQNQDTLLVHYLVDKCDSLVKAHESDPNFVILDVRTPNEHNIKHLVGAINRDYYRENFQDLLDALPRNKTYLLHCAAGSRSGNTFIRMRDLGFTRVVNMVGGINAWSSASLPTTTEYAPLQMAVSDTLVPMDTIEIGQIDTIQLTVTNRANDTLKFLSYPQLDGTEFSTNFDTETILTGAEDYTFAVFYEPADEDADYLRFFLESNGETVSFHIFRTGKNLISAIKRDYVTELKVYPNPAVDHINIDGLRIQNQVRYNVFDLRGMIVKAGYLNPNTKIDISNLERGAYIFKMNAKGGYIANFIVVD
jgi:rhodanese-related sulfurtransferase